MTGVQTCALPICFPVTIDGQVRFEQVLALGELQITWTGSDSGEVSVSDEFDRLPNPEADSLGDDGTVRTENGGDE